MISTTILAVLTVIEQLLPMLGTGNATVTLVESIVDALVKLEPYIVNEISTVYTAVKNIIAQLKNSGAVTPDQLTTLNALDTNVDSAWTAVEGKIDPDAVGGDPGAAKPTT